MSQSLVNLIHKQMDFIVNGNSWHASQADLLNSVSPEEAAWRPAEGGHTIYELTVHLAYSAEEVSSRLQGNAGQWDEQQSWVETPRSLTAEAWQALISRLHDARRLLAEQVAALGDDKLAAERDGGKPPLLDMLLQIVHHEAFHTGQIALLRRQQGKAALM